MSKQYSSSSESVASDTPSWLQFFDEFMATIGQTDPTPNDAIAANSYLHMAFIGQVRSDATSIEEAVALIRAQNPLNPLEFIVPEGVNADVLESFTRAGVALMTAAEHMAAHPEQHPVTHAHADEVALGGGVSESKGDDSAE